jgi:hypothetical protein
MTSEPAIASLSNTRAAQMPGFERNGNVTVPRQRLLAHPKQLGRVQADSQFSQVIFEYGLQRNDRPRR